MGPETLQPPQLVVVVVVADLTSVGNVDAVDPDRAAGGGDETGVGVGLDTDGETVDHVVDTQAGQDGHAVPLTLPVVGHLVTEIGKNLDRHRIIGQLGLLQAHDVGPDLSQPLLDPRHAGVQRIDIPRGNEHRLNLPLPTIRARRDRTRPVDDPTDIVSFLSMCPSKVGSVRDLSNIR